LSYRQRLFIAPIESGALSVRSAANHALLRSYSQRPTAFFSCTKGNSLFRTAANSKNNKRRKKTSGLRLSCAVAHN